MYIKKHQVADGHDVSITTADLFMSGMGPPVTYSTFHRQIIRKPTKSLWQAGGQFVSNGLISSNTARIARSLWRCRDCTFVANEDSRQLCSLVRNILNLMYKNLTPVEALARVLNIYIHAHIYIHISSSRIEIASGTSKLWPLKSGRKFAPSFMAHMTDFVSIYNQNPYREK